MQYSRSVLSLSTTLSANVDTVTVLPEVRSTFFHRNVQALGCCKAGSVGEDRVLCNSGDQVPKGRQRVNILQYAPH